SIIENTEFTDYEVASFIKVLLRKLILNEPDKFLIKNLEKCIKDIDYLVEMISPTNTKFNENQPLSKLPNESLLQVFSLLGTKRNLISASLTSKHFYNVAQMVSLKKLSLGLDYAQPDSETNFIFELPTKFRLEWCIPLSEGRIATCEMSNNKIIRIWDSNNSLIGSLKHNRSLVSFILLSNGNLASISERSITVWNLDDYSFIAEFAVNREGYSAPECLGRSIIEVYNNKLICSSYIENKCMLTILDLNKRGDEAWIKFLPTHAEDIDDLAILSKHNIAISFRDHIEIWDLSKPDDSVCIDSLPGYSGILARIPNNRLAISKDSHVIIWDVKQRACITELDFGDRASNIAALLCLPNNMLASWVQVYTGGYPKSLIKIWDLNNFTCVSTIDMGQAYPYGVHRAPLSILSDGRLVSAAPKCIIHNFKPLTPVQELEVEENQNKNSPK
ncbi:MAG: F-box-like domain-containing protein, partial [Tatlockia sp.]|nr:F-box-like domain-containing protein [Tatlockia sp.]